MGGAATAHAVFDGKPESNPHLPPAPRPVVVKLPLGPREHRILTGLGATSAPTPRVLASGRELGGYDFAWVVMERLDGLPLSAHLHKEVFDHVIDAVVRFSRHAADLWPLDPPPPGPDWSDLLDRSRRALKDNPGVPNIQQWASAAKRASRALPHLLDLWDSRSINTWCHGDLHPGNCMRRTDGQLWAADPGFVLFDFAEVHAGHWVEDAVYLERLYWGRPQVLEGVKPVSLLARARRNAGLETGDDYGTLADIRRLLMGVTAPAFLHREGYRAYMDAALQIVERLLKQFT